jgi:hypothetical protein
MPGVQRALMIAFAGLFVAGLVVWIIEMRSHMSKWTKRAMGKAAAHLGWTGIVGLLLWMFTYERLPVLSMRFFYILWAVWFVLGAVFVVRFVWVKIPELEARNKERMEREKWLPKSKK